MTGTRHRCLYWTPRVLGIVFALFLGLFALDVFEEHQGFWPMLLALLLHLVPVYLVAGALWVAWRWERVGALLFLGLAASYVVFAWGHFSVGAFVVISGPLAAIGGLFLLGASAGRIRS